MRGGEGRLSPGMAETLPRKAVPVGSWPIRDGQRDDSRQGPAPCGRRYIPEHALRGCGDLEFLSDYKLVDGGWAGRGVNRPVRGALEGPVRDADLHPGAPIAPCGCRHEPRVPHVRLGPGRRPVAGAALPSTPFLPTTRYKPNSDPQLVSLIGWRVE